VGLRILSAHSMLASNMDASDFLIEEYKSRVHEMRELMAEARKLELYCAGAVAAIYSWFAAVNLENTVAWYIPLLVPVLGLIRSWAFYVRVRQISEYIRDIESHFLSKVEQPQGWENDYAKIRAHGLTPSGLLFWAVLVLVCLVVPYVLTG